MSTLPPIRFGFSCYPFSRFGDVESVLKTYELLDRLGFHHTQIGEHFIVPGENAQSLDTLWYDGVSLAATALAGAALTGTPVYRVPFWQDLGMAPTLVGLGTALDPLCVVFSALAFGLVADRFPVRYLGFVGLLGFGASVLPMIVSNGEPWTILAHGALWGIAAGGYITLNNMVWPNYYGREFIGAIRGIVLPVSVIASGAGAPIIGYLLEALPAQTVWAISTGTFWLAAVLVLLAKPPKLRRAPAVTAQHSTTAQPAT